MRNFYMRTGVSIQFLHRNYTSAPFGILKKDDDTSSVTYIYCHVLTARHMLKTSLAL